MGIRSLEELKKLDDNGDFDSLVKEATRLSNGDTSLMEVILTQSTVAGFVQVHAIGKRLKKTDQEAVPKKPRSSTIRVRRRQFPPNYNISSPSSSSSTTTTSTITKPSDRDHNTSSTCKKRRWIDDQEIIKKTAESGNYEEIKKKVIKRPKQRRPDPEELKRQGYCLELPEEVKGLVRQMEGTEPLLVIMKYVTETDLSDRHVRFNMPVKQLEVEKGDKRFLREEEWERLLSGKGSVSVRLVGPRRLEASEMDLRMWKMNESENFVLTAGWNHVMKKYRNSVLNAGGIVQVWAFRCNAGKDLWLALLVLEHPVKAVGVGGGSAVGGEGTAAGQSA